MSKIRISRLTGERDNAPIGEDLEWSELASMLGLGGVEASTCTLDTCAVGDNLHRWTDRGGKEHAKGCRHKYGPAWSPAVYPPGATRANRNVGSVSALVVDIDHVKTDADLEKAYAPLEAYSHIAHPSHSDKPGDRCWRFVVALSEPVQRDDWPRFWATAMAEFGQPADPSCCDAARLYFLPTRRADSLDGQVKMNANGPTLNVRAILAKAPPRAPERELGDVGDMPPASPEVLEDCRERLRRHGPAIEFSGGDRKTFSACAILVHGYALTELEAWPLLLEWNETCEPPWDEDELRTKLDNAGNYASGPRGAQRLEFESATSLASSLLAPINARRAEAVARAAEAPPVTYDTDAFWAALEPSEPPADDPEPAPFVFDHAKALEALAAAKRREPYTGQRLAVRVGGERRARKPLRQYMSGLPDLDALIGGGITTRQLTVIMAPPADGKSALAVSIALNVQGAVPVLYASTELETDELESRIAANVIGCSWTEIARGRGPGDAAVVRSLDGLRVHVIGSERLPRGDEAIGAIEAEVEAMTSDYGIPPLVVVDYVQDLARGTDEKSVRAKVGELASRLRAMSQQLDCAVLAVSSVSRSYYGTAKATTMREAEDAAVYLAAAKESGDVDYAAAVVMFLDVAQREGNAEHRVARVAVAKARHGRTGFVGARFHGATGRWEHAPEALVQMTPEARQGVRQDKREREADERLLRVLREHPGKPWGDVKA